MISFKFFHHTLRYLFYILFFRNAWKHMLFFLSLVVCTVILLPIFQTELESLSKTDNIVQESGRSDFLIKLPKRKIFLKLKTDLKQLNQFQFTKGVAAQIVDQNRKKYDFESVFVKRVGYNDLQGKRFFSFETAFFNQDSPFGQNNFSQVSLVAGRAPSSEPEDLETVVSSKYAKLNNIKLGDQINVFNVPLKVVGIGDNVRNLSSDFLDTYKVRYFLKLDEGENMFKYFGIAYVHENLFEYFYQKNDLFNNFENNLYLKFAPTVDINAAKSDFVQEVKNYLDYDPQVLPFVTNIASGARTIFIRLVLIAVGIVYVCAFFFFLCWFCYITYANLFKQKNLVSILRFFGSSKREITLATFLINLFLLMLMSFTAYLFSFGLYQYFIDYNNRLSFLDLEFVFFDFWPLFLQVFVAPLLWAVASSLFIFLKLKELNYFWQSDKNNLLLTEDGTNFSPFPTTRASWSIFTISTSRLKSVFSLLFINVWKKILLLILTVSLFFFFFFVVFAKFSSDDFVFKQWNFLQPSVKSFTKLKEHISVKKNSQLASDVHFVGTDELASNGNLKPIRDLQKVNLESSFLFDRDKVIERSMRNWFIDQNIESAAIKNYMKDFDIEKIYFNVLVHNRQQDMLLMIGDANTNGQNASIYFMPKNWKNFFQISQLDSQLDNFQFQDDNSLGIDPSGIQYAIAPYFWKNKGYQLGDIVTFEDMSFDRVALKRRTQFKIAGFTDKKFLIADILFTDYDYLSRHKLIASQIVREQPYNFIFSTTTKKHINRNLTLNFAKIKPEVFLNVFAASAGGLELDLLSLTNLESITLQEFTNLSDFHFRLYRQYLSFILGLTFFFLFAFLIVVLSLTASNSGYGLSKMLLWGYRTKEMIWRLFFSAIVLMSSGLVIAFVVSSTLFNILINLSHKLGIYIPLPETSFYFLYAIAIFLVVILFYLFSNWLYLKTNKLKLIK